MLALRPLLIPAVLLASLLAGCSSPEAAPAHDAEVAPLSDALAAWRDGNESANVHRIGQWGEGAAEVDACGHWLFVDAGASVQILDVSRPGEFTEVADVTGLPDIQDVKASDDCNWLFIGNDQEGSSPPLGGTVPALTGGFYVVDIHDKADPKLVSALPVGPRRGPHMVYYHQMADGRELVFGANADISINEFDRGTGTLRELSRYQADLVTAFNRDPEVFDVLYQGWAHDMVAEIDATGRSLMYVANWDAGLRIVDLSDPSAPRELGGWNAFPEGHEGNLHTVSTEVIGGRTITVGAVEVGFAVVGGVHYVMNTDRSIVYVWDTTDPTNIVLVGQWENPDRRPADRAEVDGAEGSTHNLQLEGGRIYLAHYNMGVFVLDASTPDAQQGPPILGFHREPGDTVWDVVLADGYLYSAGTQGVLALHFAPDATGEQGMDSNA